MRRGNAPGFSLPPDARQKLQAQTPRAKETLLLPKLVLRKTAEQSCPKKEWQHMGDQNDAAMTFVRAAFVKVDAHKQV